MYDPIETFEVDGLTVEIHFDDDPTPPSDWDQLGTLVAFSPLWREYQFAERESTGDEDEALERGGLPLLARYLRMTQGATIVPFTFHDYGSSGARLFAGDLSDDRAAGFIIATPESADKLGVPADDVERQLHGELSEWGAWVEQDVRGFIVRDKDGKTIDSCWGFYPETGERDEWAYLLDEARSQAEADAEAIVEQKRKAASGWLAAHRREEAIA